MEGCYLLKFFKWLFLLLPLISYPIFALLEVAYGFSFDLIPGPTEKAHFYAAILSTLYAATWLTYLFACMKWYIKVAIWIYLTYWVCATLTLLLVQSDTVIRAFAPLALSVLPLIGYSEKAVWGNIVCVIMLLLGAGVLVFVYHGSRKNLLS